MIAAATAFKARWHVLPGPLIPSSRPAVGKRRDPLAALFLPVQRLASHFDNAAAIYGRIRADLDAKGHGIGSLDTLIAAHALALSLTLVTNNEREFRRVPDLKVVNWVA